VLLNELGFSGLTNHAGFRQGYMPKDAADQELLRVKYSLILYLVKA